MDENLQDSRITEHFKNQERTLRMAAGLNPPVDWEHGFEFISPVAVLPGAQVRLQVDYTDQLWEPPTWKPVTEMMGRCTKCEVHDDGFWCEIEVS